MQFALAERFGFSIGIPVSDAKRRNAILGEGSDGQAGMADATSDDAECVRNADGGYLRGFSGRQRPGRLSADS